MQDCLCLCICISECQTCRLDVIQWKLLGSVILVHYPVWWNLLYVEMINWSPKSSLQMVNWRLSCKNLLTHKSSRFIHAVLRWAVHLTVCQAHELWENERIVCLHFHAIWKVCASCLNGATNMFTETEIAL